MKPSKYNSALSYKKYFIHTLLFIIFLMPISASAQILTFEFEGYIDNIVKNENNVIEGVYLGQTFNGWFNYSTDVPDLYPSNPLRGTYYQDASIVVNLGDQTFPYIDGFINFFITNDNDGDEFLYGVDGAYGDYSFTSLRICLTDSTGTAFATDELPLSLNIEDFDSALFRMVGDEIATSDFFQIEGQITNIQYVPEPASLLLLALGAAVARKKYF